MSLSDLVPAKPQERVQRGDLLMRLHRVALDLQAMCVVYEIHASGKASDELELVREELKDMEKDMRDALSMDSPALDAFVKEWADRLRKRR